MTDNKPHIHHQPEDPAALQQLLHALAVAAGVYSSPAPGSIPSYPTVNTSQSTGLQFAPSAAPIIQPYPYPLWSQQTPNPISFGLPIPNGPAQASTSGFSGFQTDKDASQPINTAEEKRRRNTEASARFRVKKKLKAVHLQRTVDDLSGRADELEKEVAELRKENSWLKEIVMLKGVHIAAGALTGVRPIESSARNLNPEPKTGPDVQQDDGAASDTEIDPNEKRLWTSKGKRKSES